MTQETSAKKDTQRLQRAIVDGLEDVKAQDIQVFNTEHLSPLFERVIVASGTSNRQTKALAHSVMDAVKEAGFSKPRMEGAENGEWIIVDCGAAVAHIMQPTIRQYYHLEEIWGDKPVRLRLGAPKPAQPEKAPVAAQKSAPPPSLRRSSAVKTAARSAKREADEAKKKPTARAGAKGAAFKATAKRGPASKASVSKATSGKASSGKASVSKVASAKGSVSKASSGKAPARKAPAKKAPAKKK